MIDRKTAGQGQTPLDLTTYEIVPENRPQINPSSPVLPKPPVPPHANPEASPLDLVYAAIDDFVDAHAEAVAANEESSRVLAGSGGIMGETIDSVHYRAGDCSVKMQEAAGLAAAAIRALFPFPDPYQAYAARDARGVYWVALPEDTDADAFGHQMDKQAVLVKLAGVAR